MADEPDEPITISTRFERALLTVESELSSALQRARAEADHAGIKGNKVEVATRKVLHDRLPPNLSVGEGIVYDSFGDETGQTDIIIANGDQPFTFPWGESGEYAIEGVSAVGEVKSKLTDAELRDCIKKATVYKRLRQIIRTGDRVLNPSQYSAESSFMPPFFVIAHESSMTMRNVLTKLEATPAVSALAGKAFTNDTPQPPIDAVCVLGMGAALNQRSGHGAAFKVNLGDGSPKAGWISIEGDTPLAITLSWLHMAMPRILRAGSLVDQYFVPPSRQARYMVNKARAAKGLEPLPDNFDFGSITINVTPHKRARERRTAKKATEATTASKEAAKKTPPKKREPDP